MKLVVLEGRLFAERADFKTIGEIKKEVKTFAEVECISPKAKLKQSPVAEEAPTERFFLMDAGEIFHQEFLFYLKDGTENWISPGVLSNENLEILLKFFLSKIP